jgi:hypothetical protein
MLIFMINMFSTQGDHINIQGHFAHLLCYIIHIPIWIWMLSVASSFLEDVIPGVLLIVPLKDI